MKSIPFPLQWNKTPKAPKDPPGGFIQDEDGGVFDEGPGDGDALFLPSGHGHPSLPEHGVVALGEVADEVVSVGQFGCFKHLVRQGEQLSATAEQEASV